MYTTIDWGKAEWIGSPEITLDAARRGVFGLEAEFAGSGGIVFGADDERLKTVRRNIQNQAGEHYISYRLDVAAKKLIITRVGYAEGDSADVPFAALDVSNIKPTNTLRIEITGNNALTYLNGELADGEYISRFPGAPKMLVGRQLNPLGNNDCITFPRLNKCGLLAGSDYTSFRIFDLRPPSAELYRAEDCAALVGTLTDPSHGGVSLLRRELDISKEIKSASLHASARGIYFGTVNGQELRVGKDKDYFTPGISHFDRHIFFHSYDVAKMLKPGKNTLDFTLGSGWWSDAQGFVLTNYNFWGNNPALLMRLEIEYTDGSRDEVVTSPDGWHVSNEGPIRYASYFHGETYDARLEENITGWKKPVVVGTTEQRPVGFVAHPPLNLTEPEIIEHIGNPVREVDVLTAKFHSKVQDSYIYDMGQNMVGLPRIKLKGRPGQVITLRFAEVLYPNLPEYGYLNGMIMTENLRDADCTDIYICKGDPAGEVIFPHLTFHGYRYLEITGTDEAIPETDIEGIVLSSITEWTGSFECSDPMVNKLHENIRWSQRANFLSIPTDCPQRNERMGWMGDAQVFAGTSVYNADVLEFFERFMISVRDLQHENGKFPNIAPNDNGFGGILWESAGVIVPWELYRQYGKKQVLEDNFEAMRRYADYLLTNSEDGLLKEGVGRLGDWLASDMSTDNELVWNAVFAYNMRILADSAKILGKPDIAEKMNAAYEQIKSAWNKTFIDPSSGKTRNRKGEINDTQCSYAQPLFYGIVEDAARAAKLLNEKTIALDYTLTTGFVGTQCISAALSDNGYAETAYKLLRQTKFPSWLYSITQGATSIWERWNSYTVENGFGGNNNMNSFNHYSLGAVGAWLYSRVLGIMPGEAGGYKDFVLKPCFGGLEFAKGHYDCEYGRISSAWEKTDSGYKWKVEIPEGTSALLLMPGGKQAKVNAGVYEYDFTPC